MTIEIRVVPQKLDEAARYIQKIRGEDTWKDNDAGLRDRYRDDIHNILRILGVTLDARP